MLSKNLALKPLKKSERHFGKTKLYRSFSKYHSFDPKLPGFPLELVTVSHGNETEIWQRKRETRV
jgi:hypothetical protein